MTRLAGLPDFPQSVSVRIVADRRDLLDALLLVSIGQANVEHLDREPVMADRHGDLNNPPPAERLRPISVNALAATLRIPFETARHRVNRLLSEKACVSSRRGVMLSASYWGSERHRFRALAVHHQARNLYLGLVDLRVLRPPMFRGEATRLPLLAIDRLASSYVLRQLNALATHFGDLDLGLLMIYVIRLTTDHLDDTYTEFTQRDDLVVDELRRPIPVSLLAVRLGASGETVRRHAHTLIERGWLARDAKGGVYLTREMLRDPRWAAARAENVANLNRFITGLGDAGVLALWGEVAPSL